MIFVARMVRVHWYPALLQDNPKYQPTVDQRSVGLFASARQNLATSLALPLNNVTLRSRYFSPREVQAIAPTVVQNPTLAWKFIGKPSRLPSGRYREAARMGGAMNHGTLVLSGSRY